MVSFKYTTVRSNSFSSLRFFPFPQKLGHLVALEFDQAMNFSIAAIRSDAATKAKHLGRGRTRRMPTQGAQTFLSRQVWYRTEDVRSAPCSSDVKIGLLLRSRPRPNSSVIHQKLGSCNTEGTL